VDKIVGQVAGHLPATQPIDHSIVPLDQRMAALVVGQPVESHAHPSTIDVNPAADNRI
jgi:hypothetical protein